MINLSFEQYIITFVSVILLVLAAGKIVNWVIGFPRELKYINREIGRTHGEEKRYWKRKKAKLIFSFLPFVKY